MLTPDKRDHFRLVDHILVRYRHVPTAVLKSESPEAFFDTGPGFTLRKELYRLDVEAREQLRDLSRRDRDMGAFLGNLNQRVELLAKGMLADDVEPDDFEAPAKISRGGISFLTDELLTRGSPLALKLVFRSSLLAFAAFAEVRHCRLAEDGEQYVVGTRFIDLDPATDALVERYIIHRQAEDRRARLRGS